MPDASDGSEDEKEPDGAEDLASGECRRGVGADVLTHVDIDDVGDPTSSVADVLPSGNAFPSSSSSSSGLRASSDESDDEDMFAEVEQTKKAKKVKKKAKVKVHPDPPSKECGVAISTEHLSYLTNFRVRGRSEELKHTVTNSSGMTLIVGFPSKDEHFENRFFFVEISERTVEADCIDLVKTRWERRVKPSLPEVSKEFVTAMHTELSSRNGNWRKSFSRRRIERALSAEIFPGKILGRGQARMSFREQAALEAAAKAKGSSGTHAPRAVAPMTSTPTAPGGAGELAEFSRLSTEKARISSGKGKGVDRVTPSKRQRVDTSPTAVVGNETSASHVGGLLRDEAYSAVKSKASELSLLFYSLVGDYDEDVRSRDNELSVAKEANAVLQIGAAIAEARDEMARGFAERTSEVARLLAEIGGKVQNDMLNLIEIDANLEFIGLLQGSEPPDLPTEVKALRERRHPIYDAHDVFADLLASVRRVLEFHVVSAGAALLSTMTSR
ncbi:hypothetical protein AALP_AA3G299300 [Arabis alpina]|uniref:Uncharacterized protein n=1 Tax=Arabis alpina TaxID=50452 RepID=A0A087HCL9_ARAAL|nr:hypothetical protein AALP_AA3G299300 [Arabis alpina]